MKFYGINLNEGSDITNLSVSSGSSFPSSANNGELFYLGSGDVGLYTYANGVWNKVLIAPVTSSNSSNFNITSPSTGQLLKYDGTNWVNSTISYSIGTLSDTSISSPISGQYLKYNGTNWVNSSLTYAFSNLTGVNVSSLIAGQQLVYDGTNWINSTPTSTITRKAITSNYTILNSDTYLAIRQTSAITLSLPAGSANKQYIIKDELGQAGTHPITITANGSETIDGQSSVIININYGSVTLYFGTNNWSII